MKYIITEEQLSGIWFKRRHSHIKEVIEILLGASRDSIKGSECELFISYIINYAAATLADLYKLSLEEEFQLWDYIKDKFEKMISDYWYAN